MSTARAVDTLDPRASALLAFWFDGACDGVDVPQGSPASTRWFSGGSQLDDFLRARFGADADAALRGDLDVWVQSPRGRLALVLLLDQLPRNIFRGTARVFEGDARAQELATLAVELGIDRALGLYERAFIYMPFMHAETLALHDAATSAFGTLRDDAHALQPGTAARFDDFVRYEALHRAIIVRFGRYPHRNAILGRTSTPEEIEFLQQPGSAF